MGGELSVIGVSELSNVRKCAGMGSRVEELATLVEFDDRKVVLRWKNSEGVVKIFSVCEPLLIATGESVGDRPAVELKG